MVFINLLWQQSEIGVLRAGVDPNTAITKVELTILNNKKTWSKMTVLSSIFHIYESFMNRLHSRLMIFQNNLY